MENESKPQIVDVPLDQIVMADNDRQTYTGIEELAESIDEDGLIQPIRLRPLLAGQYEIVAGHRRYLACKHLGRPTIEAIVGELSDGSASRIMWAENQERVSLNPIDEAKALKKRIDKFGLTTGQLANETRRSQSWVDERLSLLSLSAHVQHLLATGQMKLGYGLAMVGLDVNRQVKAVSALSSMKSVAEYEALCGKLLSEQMQESMFDMSQFMVGIAQEHDDAKARKALRNFPDATDLPDVDRYKTGGCVFEFYIQKLIEQGYDREAAVIGHLYMSMIQFRLAKPCHDSPLTGGSK